MYSLHDVKVTGLSLDKILACEIQSHIGEHSTLKLSGLVENEEEFLYGVSDGQDIEVIIQGSEGTKNLFSGIVTGVSITESGQMKTACVEGKSRSWLMDRTKHSRSFQNAHITFQALTQEILKDYTGSSLIYTGDSREIGNLIIQYEETDWDFLKRVLSLVGLALTPDSQKAGLKLFAGVPKFPETALSYTVLEMDKDMDSYYYLKANKREVHAADFTQYIISSEQLMGIFDTAAVQGQPLAVYAYQYSFEQQEMIGTYCLQSAKGLVVQASYPMHLIGAALMAKVVRVSKNKIQAAMEIDGAHIERAVHWFPYSTLSASPDGSGWYCMPEIGDDVRIYFPSKQEAEAIALSAVSNYDAPQGGSDRMQDPNNRYFRTKYGQELALNADSVKLSCNEDKSSISILTDGTIRIQAQESVNVQAKEKITLHAENELSIRVKDQFLMQSNQGGLVLSEGNKIIIRGTEVKFD
ncbi:MAG: contractile injection system protein, VgrG/Pvc8 family [Lachnospiraceae bacterium]|nr:contractile injection system protein, VgrG/Pvc8 family [Lachnospiraceae bacterium]MCX4299851.1 contractile injection system protein, VgrG/Pvc8 family [Lachnospiraceae bacterium]